MAAGNLLAVTITTTNTSTYSGVKSYTYDALDQLTQEKFTFVGTSTTLYNQSYLYDATGNPTTLRNVANFTYNADNQATGTGNVFDGEGNPTTYRGFTMAYDLNDQLVQMNAIPGTWTAGYLPDGLRAWKQLGSSGRTYYLYSHDVCHRTFNL